MDGVTLFLEDNFQRGPLGHLPYEFFILGSNVHLRHICMVNGPSVTAWRIFKFVHCPINLHSISNECNLNEISSEPVEYGVSTYSLQIFCKKFDFASFSVEPCGVEHSRFNKPYKLHIESIIENWNEDHSERYSNFYGLYIKFQGCRKWPWTW